MPTARNANLTMSEELNFLPSITGSFAQPAAENPTVEMVEAAYRHHGLHYRYLNTEVTPDNLAAAVAGETHEYTDMYPGFAATARAEGFSEVADWFETLAKAEKSHAGRFEQLLGTIS